MKRRLKRMPAALTALVLVLAVVLAAAPASYADSFPYDLNNSIVYSNMTDADKSFYETLYRAILAGDSSAPIPSGYGNAIMIAYALRDEAQELCAFDLDSSGIAGSSYKIAYSKDPDVQREFISEVQSVAARFKGRTDYDGIRAVHDYVLDKIRYENVSGQAYEAMKTGKGDIGSYARTMNMLCHFAGYKSGYMCFKGTSMDDGSSAYTAWNIVDINGVTTYISPFEDDNYGRNVSYGLSSAQVAAGGEVFASYTWEPFNYQNVYSSLPGGYAVCPDTGDCVGCPYNIHESILYNTFTPDEKALFDALYAAVLTGKKSVDIPKGMTMDEVDQITHAFIHQAAELCSYNWGTINTSTENGKEVPVNYTINYRCSISEQNDFLQYLTETSQLFAGKSEKEGVRAVHDYLIRNYRFYEGDDMWNTQFCWHALKTGDAVCSGYAQSMKVLCNFAGYPCSYVDGLIGNPPANHAWNIVKFGDTYTLIDPSRDDCLGNTSYYGFSSADSTADGRQLPGIYSRLPNCSRTGY